MQQYIIVISSNSDIQEVFIMTQLRKLNLNLYGYTGRSYFCYLLKNIILYSPKSKQKKIENNFYKKGLKTLFLIFQLISNKAQRWFRKYLEPRGEKRPTSLSDMPRYLEDRWLARSERPGNFLVLIAISNKMVV